MTCNNGAVQYQLNLKPTENCPMVHVGAYLLLHYNSENFLNRLKWSIWWVRFTPSTNYNQFLPCPGLNWSRYGIVHSERLGYQLWHRPLKMASLVYEREITKAASANFRYETTTLNYGNMFLQKWGQNVTRTKKPVYILCAWHFQLSLSHKTRVNNNILVHLL